MIMKRILSLVLSLVLILGCIPFSTVSTQKTCAATRALYALTEKSGSGKKAEYLEGEVILTLTVPKGTSCDLLHEGALPGDRTIYVKRVMCFDDAESLARNRSEKKSFHGKDVYIVHAVSTAHTTKQLKAYLSRYSNVISAVPNYRTYKMAFQDSKPNDPYFDEQWYLGGESFFKASVDKNVVSGSGATVLSDTPGKDSYAVPAASIGFSPEEKKDLGDDTPIVAVVDDGVDYTHEDLKNRMWINPYSKKQLEGKYGYDFINYDDDPIPSYGDEHATQIAGIIAAESDNGIGISGICKNAKIMSIKVYDRQEGSVIADLAAFDYIYKAMKLGANIVAVNCSFGSPEPFEYEYPETTEMCSAYDICTKKVGALGAVSVWAAGNERCDIDKYKYGMPMQFDRTYVLSVGASTFEGKPCGFSNYGAKNVDLFAPGDGILTTVGDNIFNPTHYSKEKKEKLCLFYDDFSDKSLSSVRTITDITASKKSGIEIRYSDWDFHGNMKNGCLEVNFPIGINTDSQGYTVYFDITDKKIDPGKEYYISFDYLPKDYGVGDWYQIDRKLSESADLNIFSKGGRTYLALDFRMLMSQISDCIGCSIKLDNLSISVADPSVEEFDRYGYAGGTSFSAPIVAASIARLAVMYPNDNALTRRAKIMASTRKLSGLKGKCVCNGTLDISKFGSVADIYVDPIITKVKKIELNKTSAKLKAGKKIALKATILPAYADNLGLSWSVSNKKWATVSSKGIVTAKKAGAGHTVKVTVTSKDGSKVKAFCKIRITK